MRVAETSTAPKHFDQSHSSSRYPTSIGEACSQISPSSLLAIQRASGVLPVGTWRPQHLPQGAETLQPLQMKTALCQQGFGLLAADLAIFQRFTDGPLHPIQRPQRLLARLLEILRQHGQGIRQYPFGEAVVGFTCQKADRWR